MEYLQGLWHNKILIAALAGWTVAQAIKAILYAVITRQFTLKRLVGSGGMPSSHASTVCAMATATAMHYGTASFEFAIAFMLAVVVLYDARGVRWETGKQAMTISAIVEFLKQMSAIEVPDLKLKELVGHTPLQVAVGMVLGVGTGLLMG